MVNNNHRIITKFGGPNRPVPRLEITLGPEQRRVDAPRVPKWDLQINSRTGLVEVHQPKAGAKGDYHATHDIFYLFSITLRENIKGHEIIKKRENENIKKMNTTLDRKRAGDGVE